MLIILIDALLTLSMTPHLNSPQDRHLTDKQRYQMSRDSTDTTFTDVPNPKTEDSQKRVLEFLNKYPMTLIVIQIKRNVGTHKPICGATP
jgi:hypothetical protein